MRTWGGVGKVGCHWGGAGEGCTGPTDLARDSNKWPWEPRWRTWPQEAVFDLSGGGFFEM